MFTVHARNKYTCAHKYSDFLIIVLTSVGHTLQLQNTGIENTFIVDYYVPLNLSVSGLLEPLVLQIMSVQLFIAKML